jgi:hypothetical protein
MMMKEIEWMMITISFMIEIETNQIGLIMMITTKIHGMFMNEKHEENTI